MAERIADGHGYVFFAGQEYMGAAAQYLQALTLTLWPSSPAALRLPDLLLADAAVPLVYAAGRRLLGSRGRELGLSEGPRCAQR